MQARKKKVNNDIGKHCDMLVKDFFNFCDGNGEPVLLIDIRDIAEPMPPEVDQIKKMFAMCKKAWYDYCGFANLSRMNRFLFENRVKKVWLQKARKQEKDVSQEKMRSATN